MAESPQPQIQLISKTSLAQQLVTLTLPRSVPHPLAPNTARLRTRTLALTTNVLTYAKLGGIPSLGWWDVWPMPHPTSLPPPFDNEATLAGYCRVGAWGYSEVVESRVPGLEVGTWLFGYQAIGTLAEIVELEKGNVEGQSHWVEVSERRKGLNGIYNLYIARERGEDREGRGWDALMEVLFGTAWLMNRFVFSWGEGVDAVHPLGIRELAWTEEDADLTDAVVVMLAASGKTGFCFARELRERRPRGKQPFKVIAVGSERSREFTKGLGLFDEVLLYNDLEEKAFDLEARLVCKQRKVVLMDFGARDDAVDRWAKALEGKCRRMQALVIGGDPMAEDQSKTARKTQDLTSNVAQVFAGGIRDRAMELVGAARYFADQEAAWADFKADRGIQALTLKWGKGVDGFSNGWEALVSGEYGPDTGLVYDI
ncbi:hypothetical protein VTI74DRAFT_6669 [Chaetomium olivicolor]